MIKLALLALGFSLGVQAQAEELVNAPVQKSWDGCYQLVAKDVLFPAICFQGTEEEGINGEGVRLFVFMTGTNIQDACAIGRVSRMTATELTFEKNGIEQVKLTEFDGVTATADIYGFTSLVSAVRVDGIYTERLMSNSDSSVCK